MVCVPELRQLEETDYVSHDLRGQREDPPREFGVIADVWKSYINRQERYRNREHRIAEEKKALEGQRFRVGVVNGHRGDKYNGATAPSTHRGDGMNDRSLGSHQ